MKNIIYTSLLTMAIMLIMPPYAYAENLDIKECLESVEKYMGPEDAERFCKQPADCRKWWDDMTEEEREEIYTPEGKQYPDWWDEDECYVMRIEK